MGNGVVNSWVGRGACWGVNRDGHTMIVGNDKRQFSTWPHFDPYPFFGKQKTEEVALPVPKMGGEIRTCPMGGIPGPLMLDRIQ